MLDNTEVNTQISRDNANYAAGIIDGEGSIVLNRGQRIAPKTGTKYYQYVYRVSVVNTDIRLIEWLHKTFGGSLLPLKKTGKRHKKTYLWHITKTQTIVEFLNIVAPFLKMKQEQAHLMLEYLQNYYVTDTMLRDSYYWKFKELNKRGITVTTDTQDISDEMKIQPVLTGDHEYELEEILVS